METPPSEFPSELSWDEFLALPYETRNASLIDGKVIVNSPNAQHELVLENFILMFRQWRGTDLSRGEVSTQQPVKITDRRGYQPDLAWYPAERCAPPSEPKAFSGDPGLILDVLSPSTRRIDLIRKRGDYDAIGIAEVWFVDPPERVVLVCRRTTPDGPFTHQELSEDEVISSPLLGDFELRVGDLFRR